MTTRPYTLGDQVAWTEDDQTHEGTVVACTGAGPRQVLVVERPDKTVRTIAVDLVHDSRIIASSPAPESARAVALEYLALGYVPGLSETGLANLLASALIAATDPGGAP